MIADIAHVGGTQQGIADGMDEHISIAVAQQAQFMVDADAAQPQVAVFHQLVNVVAESHTYPHSYLRLKRSLMPSMSNERVKRSVWSRGLLFAVAIT